jgi:hypothetical protein
MGQRVYLNIVIVYFKESTGTDSDVNNNFVESGICKSDEAGCNTAGRLYSY